jgi:hypothetical protein
MTIFKTIFRLLRRCLMALFIGYWLIFIFYTAEKFVTGGSSAAVDWYMPIDASPVRQGDGWVFTQWRWGTFPGRQFAILGITLALCLMEVRSRRVPRNSELLTPVPDKCRNRTSRCSAKSDVRLFVREPDIK